MKCSARYSLIRLLGLNLARLRGSQQKTYTEFLNSEIVRDLRNSRKDGELYPVIKAKILSSGKTKILSGHHRSAAGWKSIKIIEVKNDYEFLRLQLASMVQRNSSFEEKTRIINKICEIYSKEDHTPKEKVAARVVREIHGIPKTYLYEMIPDEYKIHRLFAVESEKLERARLATSSFSETRPFSSIILPPSDRLIARMDQKPPDRVLRMICAHEGCSRPLYVNVTKQEAYHDV